LARDHGAAIASAARWYSRRRHWRGCRRRRRGRREIPSNRWLLRRRAHWRRALRASEWAVAARRSGLGLNRRLVGLSHWWRWWRARRVELWDKRDWRLVITA
jgi:hypothetical protein